MEHGSTVEQVGDHVGSACHHNILTTLCHRLSQLFDRGYMDWVLRDSSVPNILSTHRCTEYQNEAKLYDLSKHSSPALCYFAQPSEYNSLARGKRVVL